MPEARRQKCGAQPVHAPVVRGWRESLRTARSSLRRAPEKPVHGMAHPGDLGMHADLAGERLGRRAPPCRFPRPGSARKHRGILLFDDRKQGLGKASWRTAQACAASAVNTQTKRRRNRKSTGIIEPDEHFGQGMDFLLIADACSLSIPSYHQ